MRGTRAVVLLASLLLVIACAGAVMAGDIVTVPTANQLKAGEVDLATYYVDVDRDSLIAPLRPLGIDSVRIQTIYVGVTDNLEIDAHRYDVDAIGTETIWNATYLVQEEDAKHPAVVVGGRDLGRAYDSASYFISAAKTLNPPVGGPPTEPVFRLHLSMGTEDKTLFGEKRHQGLFGGIQVLLRPADPQIGLVALHDGQDLITGVTYTPKPDWPTFKAGTFGGHWWVGINKTYNSK